MRVMVSTIIGLCLFATSSNYALGAEELKLSIPKSNQEGIFAKIIGPFEKETGIKIVIVKPSSPEVPVYYKDLLAGNVEAVTASSTYETWVSNIKAAKLELPSDLTHRVIGKDMMTILAHKAVGATELTLAQLESVFSGGVMNWKQVGGADQPITVISYESKKSKNAAFRKLLLKDREFPSNTKSVVGEETDIAKAVSTTPGAVSFVSLNVPTDQLQVLKTPAIGRPVIMISRGQPSPQLQKLITFIRNNSAKLGLGN